jgi:sterol desaturase/sphingolipid hydroxylase (fatty acid hydroxylase superfamily)
VDLVAITFAYILPLSLVTVVLFAAHLGGIALALLAVEAVVIVAVVIARRRPPHPAGMAPPTSRPWLVPLVMVLVVGGVVGVAVLAASAG